MSTKLWSCGVGALASLGAYLFVAGGSPRFAATCTGAADCHACKTCSSCKHCAKEGGTCGVKKGKVLAVAAIAAAADDCCKE